jgi:integrase
LTCQGSIPPDFAEWLLQTPEAERVGRVFGIEKDANKAAGIIAKIGKKAHVVVAKDADKGTVKYASAHDLRRSFGTRWASKVKTPVLQRLMRHRNIATTLKYYVSLDADDVAADLWAKHPTPRVGNIFGNNPPREAPKAERVPDAATSENPYSKAL